MRFRGTFRLSPSSGLLSDADEAKKKTRATALSNRGSGVRLYGEGVRGVRATASAGWRPTGAARIRSRISQKDLSGRRSRGVGAGGRKLPTGSRLIRRGDKEDPGGPAISRQIICRTGD